MTTLHLIRSSFFQDTQLNNCANLLSKNDGILLLDDGCYNLQHPLFKKLPTQTFIVNVHAQARGINIQAIEPSVTTEIITIDDIPALLLRYDTTLTWQ